jgi:hypothetical protein
MGGTLFALWPNAASALTCLRERLPRMATYVEQARALADALRPVDTVRVVPDPPQASMMHLLLDVTAHDFETNVSRLASDDGIWTWPKAAPTVDPGTQKVELSVGDATCQWEPKELAGVIARLADRSG